MTFVDRNLLLALAHHQEEGFQTGCAVTPLLVLAKHSHNLNTAYPNIYPTIQSFLRGGVANLGLI